MFPRTTIHYSVDSNVGNVKKCSDGSCRDAVLGKLQDSNDPFFVKFGTAVLGTPYDTFRSQPRPMPIAHRHESGSQCVYHVLAARHPFEIARTIVDLYPILMVDDVSGWSRAKKSCSYDDVYAGEALRMTNYDGSIFTVSRTENSRLAGARRATDSTERRYAVDGAVPVKSNHTAPFFGRIVGSHRGPPVKVPWSGSDGTFAASRRADPYHTTIKRSDVP